MYRLIDSHAHLDEVEELEAALEGAKGAGVVGIVAVGSDSESNKRTLDIAARHAGYVHAALGLHPWSVGAESQHVERSLSLIEDNIQDIVALGEVGLDYDKRVVRQASKELQKEVLREVLRLAKKHHKPVSFHSRYAWRDSLELVLEVGVEGVVFHWYAGPTNILADILEAGYFVSATLAAAYHPEHRRVVRQASLQRLLVETDAPVSYRQGAAPGRPARPADVVRTLEAVAELKGVDMGVVAEQSTRNAVSLFGLGGDLRSGCIGI